MLYRKLLTKSLKGSRGISWGIICFYLFRESYLGKALKPDLAGAVITWEKVSMVTCTKDSFPKARVWVTSICQIALGLRPQGLSPNGRDGLDVGQFGQNLTICLAASLGIWNSYLKPAAFWWWVLWEFLALSIFPCKFKAITLVNASAKAFPSCKGPGKLEWALICPTIYFLSLCLISFCKSNNKEKMVVLFSRILAVSIWGNNPTISGVSQKIEGTVSQMLKSPNNCS